MAMWCERCGKGTMRGHNVSHAKNRTKKVWKPNLHAFRVLQADGARVRMMLCTQCLRIVKKAEKSTGDKAKTA